MADPISLDDLKHAHLTDLKKKFPQIETYSKPPSQPEASPVPPPPDTGLEPYTGEWNQREAKHLLNRTQFGPNLERINESVSIGLDESVNQLLADFDMPAPPVNTTSETDVPIGETWVDEVYTDVEQQQTRTFSLISWNYGLLLNEAFSIREQMTLFWHNHFAVSGGIIEDPRVLL